MSVSTNQETVSRFFEDLFNCQDTSCAVDIAAPNYVEHAVAPFGREEPGAVDGPSHLRDTSAWLLEQFPDLKMTIELMVEDGDMVAVLVRSEGTNVGKLNGVVPPTGKRFSSRQSHWFRLEDGLLAEHWATREDLPAMIQLGVIQPPGPPRG
ncbi:MAG: ester cyclase [Candidatus Nanopelagicales bacterium]